MPFDVFISYSSKDKTTADATCAALESAGIRCWIAPRDVRPGVEYAASIIEGLDACRVMVLVFSSNANASVQVHREIERAISKGLTIIPLRIEEIAPTHAMAYYLSSIHWLDALTPPLAKHLLHLTELVQANLNVGPDSPQTTVSPFVRRPFENGVRVGWRFWLAAAGVIVLFLGALVLWKSPQTDGISPVHVPPFARCGSQDDCTTGNACVDNNGDQYYYCKPICQTDAECRPWTGAYPQLRCYSHKNRNGTNFAHRVCNDNPSYAR